MKVLAEETTTLPEGAVISVYRGQMEGQKLRAVFTQLVALHSACPDKRVEMRMDDIPAHALKQYLQLTVREIMRRRAKLTTKPEWTYAPRVTHNLKQFVETMAYHGMFILKAWNEVTNTETILQGSEEVPHQVEGKRNNHRTDSGTVRGNDHGVKRRSGEAKTNRRRRKRGDERVQPDAVRPVQGQEDGRRAKRVSGMVDEKKSRPGSDPIGNRSRQLSEPGDSGEEAADVGLSEEPPF